MDTLRSFQLLSLFFLVFTFSASVFAFNMPRLGTQRKTTQHEPQTTSSISNLQDLKTYYYTQTLDHFNYRPDSYTTFKQRYVINSRYWGGANASAPIFAYLGAEESLDDDLPIIGFLSDNAPRFKALQVYIEVNFKKWCVNYFMFYNNYKLITNYYTHIYMLRVMLTDVGNN